MSEISCYTCIHDGDCKKQFSPKVLRRFGCKEWNSKKSKKSKKSKLPEKKPTFSITAEDRENAQEDLDLLKF